MEHKILLAFLLSLFAGLATMIGFLVTFFSKKTTDKKLLSFSLGLSTGVMVYVSFMELMPEAQELFIEEDGPRMGMLYTTLFFLGGILISGLIDRLVPSFENPHEVRLDNKINATSTAKLRKTGLVTAIAIGVHNFPEGIATFMASIDNITVGLAISVAIAIHNIPEGIAVSVPIYYATGSRKKAFTMTLVSALAEPLGAILAYLVLMPFISPFVMGAIYAVVSGIMIFISFDELFPTATACGEHHLMIYGLVSGMIIMAFSFILFA